MAGCIANQNAGNLLGVVLSQLVREGSPIAIAGWAGGSWNLKTMIGNYVLADEQGLVASLGRYYDLPIFGVGGVTDAKILDQQCGFETTLTMMTALLNGANIIHDIGFMNQGLQGSMQLMVIANEQLGFLRAATRGIEVNDETLALDVIEELGPTGDYLTHDHTLKHFKESFYPEILDKNSYTGWEGQGAKPLEVRAAEKVDKILAKHQPEPLPADVQQGIKEIVAREQAWVDNLAKK
jgi:trimethylamine--corrinoid protein Co-methyltransferase